MSMRMRGHLLAAVSMAAIGLAGPVAAETLADAVAMAYETNPTLQAQRATQRALDEGYVQARTGYRPTLSLSSSFGYTETRTPAAVATGQIPVDTNGDGIPDAIIRDTISESNSLSTGLNFSQPIYTGGRVAAAVSAAQADILQGRENLRRIEAQILASVIQAYADVRRDEEGLRIRRENLTVLGRQLEESQARFDVGEITRTDVAQSQARLAASRAQLQASEAQLAISRANYAAVVGRNPGQLAPEPSLAFLLPTDPDQAFSIAEQFNPQLRAQQFAEQASRARVAGARAERMPSVSLQSGVRFNGRADPFQRDEFSRGVTATVGVTVPIFSGGLVSSRIRQSVERNNTDRITVETVRRTVLQNITQFWSQLIAARGTIVSSEEQVRATRIAAEGTRQEQQVGLRTNIDVLNAEQELRQAELNQVSARRDEYVAAASVLAVMGRLEARNLTPTVPQYDAKANARRLRMAWGWVPWEEPLAIIDRTLTLSPPPVQRDRPLEPAIAPGLQPPPTPIVQPQAPAPR